MYRLFILGAGFSAPAGLPLADELWAETRQRATQRGHRIFTEDLSRFIDYKREVDGTTLHPGEVDYEEFLSFLDIEHFLRLKGSDTWSSAGNRTQLIIRNLIGEILQERTRDLIQKDYDLYLEFANLLDVRDFVISFNYDTLLEKALEQVGTPYRLTPFRYRKVGPTGGTIDSDTEELRLIKVHGSIDWFDIQPHREQVEYFQHFPHEVESNHVIFTQDSEFEPRQIVSQPHPKNSELRRVYRIVDVDTYYSVGAGVSYYHQSPLILPPSESKILYANPIREFWDGLGRAGGTNAGVGIIGYSLPKQDRYARQVVYSICTNFQKVEWDFSEPESHALTIVDQRSKRDDKNALRKRYQFIDWSSGIVDFDGFRPEALRYFQQNTD